MPQKLMVIFFIDENTDKIKVGQIIQVKVDEASEYDLWGQIIG